MEDMELTASRKTIAALAAAFGGDVERAPAEMRAAGGSFAAFISAGVLST